MDRTSPMQDIYSRLSDVGFPRPYVKDRILPDWWEDALASDPGNRRLAELVISRTLKISLEALVDQACPLSLEGALDVRFKRWHDTDHASLLPAVAIARRVFELLLSCAKNLPNPRLEGSDPGALRDRILAQSQNVALADLLRYSWDFGVPVVRLDCLPKGAKRVDGMAFFVAGRPCIALASARKSPAFLMWHLAHEMGHVAHGHLNTGAALDVRIDFNSEQEEEREANLFGKDLVYGLKHREGFSANRHLTGESLAEISRTTGAAHRIYPGCIVTSYGFNMDAWGTAQSALNVLGVANGGPEAVRAAMEDHIDLDCLSDSDRNFFTKVTGVVE